ncbi:ATP-binding protein [Arthrobacter sp. LAPM80]|uniref:sensor histidine kinase n=1 Tax=Arthrobacter sp. LAPM80 TaxID=3141788 RepID=UPI00398B6251
MTELGTAVAELRQLAHGVRPSALDDGLPAALRQLSGRSPTPLTLHIVEPLPEVPEIVGATAYFVASEAVHNATRHAQAQRISIVLKQQGVSISLRISDDGRGGARCAEGGGLAGLTDRVNALGGELRLTSAEGRGTTLEAVLPCG